MDSATDIVTPICHFTCRLPNPDKTIGRREVAPGVEIVKFLLLTLTDFGIEVLDRSDIEIRHTLECKIGDDRFEIHVGYSWSSEEGWWEVSYLRHRTLWEKLLRRFPGSRNILLTSAMSTAITAFPGMIEQRWYETYDISGESEYYQRAKF